MRETIHWRRRHSYKRSYWCSGYGCAIIHRLFADPGGIVAGYLQQGDRAGGIRVGALSGAIAALPFLLLFFVFGVFLFTGSMMGGGMGVPSGFVVVLLFAFVFALIWSVGLSALGGYLGVYIATETDIGG